MRFAKASHFAVALLLTTILLATIAAAQTDTGYTQFFLACSSQCIGAQQSNVLQNPWGIAYLPGQDFVFAENGIGRVDSYDVAGRLGSGFNVPLPAGSTLTMSKPTGMVADPAMNFHRGMRTFQFFVATEEGTIVGFSANNGQLGQAEVVVDESRSAVFTGLTLLHPSCCNPALAVANFHDARLEVYTLSLTELPGDFEDPNLPAGYAPYNIQVVGTQVFIAYAKQDAAGHDPVFGEGNGIVNIFDQDGHFIRRFISEGGKLNIPWGITKAADHFGPFAGDILIGNASDGRINVYDPATGNFLTQLTNSLDDLFVNPGLHGMVFRNDGIGDQDDLYFTAGARDVDGSFAFIGVGELTHTVVSAPDTQDGGTVNITAQVTPASGNSIVPGSVAFRVDSIEIGTVSLVNGVAILAHTFNGAGTHSVTAEYLGVGIDFLPSLGNTQVQVAPGATSTTLSGPVYIPVNASATFHARTQSANGVPIGSITFKDGNHQLGTVELASGIASLAVTLTSGAQ